jgi:hypothetical protein
MPSALSYRLAQRQALLDSHLLRPDLVEYQDSAPVVTASGALFRTGRILRPAKLEVEAARIPGGRLRLVSLSGIGDAVWTRGVLRETLKAGLQVWLDTPFEWLFWDFAGTPGFAFWREPGPDAHGLRTATYLGRDLLGADSNNTVYGAMCLHCKVPRGDFRVAVKPEWDAAADALLARIAPRKPLLVYRPLVRNHERRSVSSRNPDHAAYSAIYQAIRARFHTISVAGGSGEEIVHADAADTVFHRGELPITTLVALMRRALVYTNPGMALVMAAGLGAPVIGVFGGYEDAHNYADTVVYGPALLLDPLHPCRCMSDAHACDKRMDVPAAIAKVERFLCNLP